MFPDALIYQRWLRPKDRDGRDQTPVALELPTPEAFMPFEKPPDGSLRDWAKLFDHAENNPHRELRRRFWAEGPYWRHRDLLLWFQRLYLPGWFKGYNPMREDGADKPYDMDHILARAQVAKQGSPLKAPKAFTDRRWWYLNALGNFRAWPSWANRAVGSQCPALKLCLHSNPVTDPQAQELGLTEKGAFLLASAIDPEDGKHWSAASGAPLDFQDEKRRVAWQTAVERRTHWLYRTLYDTLEYKLWLSATTDNAAT